MTRSAPVVHASRAALSISLGWIVLLSACSRAPVQDGRDADAAAALWQQRQTELRHIRSWQLRGRLALSTPRGSWLAALRWTQDADAFRIVLSTAPLGQGSYALHSAGPGREVVLHSPDGQQHRSGSAEALLAEHLDWPLTLAGLRHWLLGLPDPQAPSRALHWDRSGRLIHLEQHGFQVSILRYRSGPKGAAALPAKLLIRRERTRLRLVIHSWEAPESLPRYSAGVVQLRRCRSREASESLPRYSAAP